MSRYVAFYAVEESLRKEESLVEADELLQLFWKDFVDLYGKESCTINMHLHGHLTQCVREYGPVYSFWCFAFERMNSILGSYRTNNRHVSVQYMRKFLDSKRYAPFNWPKEFTEEYLPLLQHFVYHKGSLMQSNVETEIDSQQYNALPPVKEGALSSSQKAEIMPHILRRLGADAESVRLHALYKQTKCLSIGRKVPDIRSLHLPLLNAHFLMSTLSWPRFFFLLSVQLI